VSVVLEISGALKCSSPVSRVEEAKTNSLGISYGDEVPVVTLMSVPVSPVLLGVLLQKILERSLRSK
jgi:hypothetical protein